MSGWLARVERRTSLENPITSLQNPSGWLMDAMGALPSTAGVRVSEHSAMKFEIWWACVRAIADTIAVLPLVLKEKLPGGGSRHATELPQFHLVKNEPNPDTTSQYWRQSMQAHICNWGNCYSEIEFSGAGDPIGLHPLLPDRTRAARILVKDEKTKEIAPKRVVICQVPLGTGFQGGSEVVLPAEKVLHIPGLGYDGVQGYPVVRMARQALGHAIAIDEFGARFFGSGARPASVITVPGSMSKDAKDRIRSSIEIQHQGLAQAHRVMVLDEGMQWHAMSTPPNDAQFVESAVASVPRICRWHRVPPHIVHDLSKGTFCLPAGTMVSTPDGDSQLTAIEQLRPGDKVWSRVKDHWVTATVKTVTVSGVDEILRIETSTGKVLRANGMHRILVAGRGRAVAMELAFEHVLPDASGTRGKHRASPLVGWVAAGDLRVGDQIVCAIRAPTPAFAHLEPIVSITREPAEPVYDIEVEGTHNFVADGVIVHNSNIEVQSIEFIRFTILQWVVAWEQWLNKRLLSPSQRGRFYFEFLIEGLLRGALKERYDAYAIGRQWGWLSADDIREIENMNPLPGGIGKVYMHPMNMVPAQAALAEIGTLPGADDGSGGGESPAAGDDDPSAAPAAPADGGAKALPAWTSPVAGELGAQRALAERERRLVGGGPSRATVAVQPPPAAAPQAPLPPAAQAPPAPAAGMPTVMVTVDAVTHERLVAEEVALNRMAGGLAAEIAHGEGEARAAAAAAKKQRQLRSAALRNKHRAAFLPMFKRAAQAIVRQEVKALRSILRRSRKRAVRADEEPPADDGALSLAMFDEEMAKFYEAFPDVIRRQFQPVVGAFAAVVQSVIYDDELGVDPPEDAADPDELAADFADDFADRHVGSAQGQLRAIVADSEEAGEDTEAAIDERLGQWEDGGDGAAVAWADKISGLESVRALASISKSSYAAAGISMLVWMAGGTSCALCDVLVGETTEIGGNFRDDGETVDPGGDSDAAPLKVRGEGGLPHAPLHSGCDCTISAE